MRDQMQRPAKAKVVDNGIRSALVSNALLQMTTIAVRGGDSVQE